MSQFASWYVGWRVWATYYPPLPLSSGSSFFLDHGTLSKVESIYYYCSISVLPKGKGPPSPTRAYQALPGITPAGGGGGGGEKEEEKGEEEEDHTGPHTGSHMLLAAPLKIKKRNFAL